MADQSSNIGKLKSQIHNPIQWLETEIFLHSTLNIHEVKDYGNISHCFMSQWDILFLSNSTVCGCCRISLYYPVIKLMLGRVKCVMTYYYASYNSLNDNKIGPKGAITLASSLQQCKELEQLEWVSSFVVKYIDNCKKGNLWR